MPDSGFLYYFIGIWGGVEPELKGPFGYEQERDLAAARWQVEEGKEGDIVFALDIKTYHSSGPILPEIWAYSSAGMEELREAVLKGKGGEDD